MESDTTTWPPEYKIKISPRSRHVRLKTSIQHGLELIVPLRFNHHEIPSILENNKSWIKKQFQKIQETYNVAEKNTRPKEIDLRAINQLWKMDYIKTHHKKISMIFRPQHECVLHGKVDDINLCKKYLKDWIRELAQLHLTEELKNLSMKMDLNFKQVFIRGQQTRWGSCSHDKVINLNFKLLFLPRELMLHILIHELCHIKHLNHSARFWKLVASFNPQWKEHNTALKQANQFIPAWIEII